MPSGFTSESTTEAIVSPCLASMSDDGCDVLVLGYASRFRRAPATRPSKPVPSRIIEDGSGAVDGCMDHPPPASTTGVVVIPENPEMSSCPRIALKAMKLKTGVKPVRAVQSYPRNCGRKQPDKDCERIMKP